MTEKQEKDLKFNHGDSLKVANLDFKAQNHYEDLTKKLFYDTEGNVSESVAIEVYLAKKNDKKLKRTVLNSPTLKM